jgi:hypothetical protein
MDSQIDSSDLPPDYNTANEGGSSNIGDICPPTTLRLAGQYIHSADSHGSPALYELSLSIDFLSERNQTVELSRLDYSIKTTAASQGKVTTRKKQIFTLRRPTLIMQSRFLYYAESRSKHALGNIGIRKSSISVKGKKEMMTVWKLTKPKDPTAELKEDEKLFLVRFENTGATYEWTLASNEQTVAEEENHDGLHVLKIKIAVDQPTRDALVSAWCLRLWDEMADQNHKSMTFKECKSHP